MGDAYGWSMPGTPSIANEYLHSALDPRQPEFQRHFSPRAASAVDMRQLSQALIDAREGTGEVRAVLLRASFKPRLPGLTKMVSKLSKEGSWRKALEVYETVEEMGLLPDTALTNSAISACDKGGRWQKALEVFDSMQRLGLPRDAITYSATISSLAKGKQWHAALQVFDHMREAGVPADVVTCCSLINALERGGQWQLAEALFLQMCCIAKDGERVSPPPPRVEGEATSAPADAPPPPGKQGEVSPCSVFDPLLSMVSAQNSSTADGAAAWKPAGDASAPSEEGKNAGEDLASQLQATLSLGSSSTKEPGPGGATPASQGNSPFVTAATLGTGIRRTGSEVPPRSASLLSSGSGAPLERSVSMLAPHTARRALSGVHDVEASAHLRRAMTSYASRDAGASSPAPGAEPSVEESPGSPAPTSPPPFSFGHAARVTPNRVCCNALLAAYARARPPQWRKAVHLLATMAEGGPSLSPDSVSYNTALKACTNAGELGRAMVIFQDMSAHGVRPNITTFNCLTAAASDAGSVPVLREIGQWLECADRDVKAACMNAFVAALVKCGQLEEPQSPIGAPWSNGAVPHPKHPTPAPLHATVSGYMKTGQYHKVRSFFFDLVGAGQAPSPALVQAMMTASSASGAWTDALEALHAVLNRGLEGSLPVGTPTFNACLGAMARCAETTPVAQHPLLASAALQVFQEMQGPHGARRDPDTYLSLIRVLASTGNPNQVLAVHEMMLGQGHTPDARGALTILQSMLALGEVGKAAFLAHSLLSQGVQLEVEVFTSLISACSLLGAWEPAQSLCAAAQVAQLPGAESAYNHLLSTALTSGQYGVMVEVLGAMQAARLSVDPGTLAALMGMMASAGSGAGSQPVLQQPTAPLPASLPEVPAPASPNPRSLFAASTPTQPPLTRGSSGGPGSLSQGPSPAQVFDSLLPASPAPLYASIEEANRELESKIGRLDLNGTIGLLTRIRDSGLNADETTYRLLILSASRTDQPHLAVQLCSQAHTMGVLKHYVLPGQSGSGWVNVRDTSMELAVTSVLTWLTLVSQLHGAGTDLEDDIISIVTGADAAGLQLQDSLKAMLTTGQAPLKAFRGLVPVALPSEAVVISDGARGVLSISTRALYAAIA